MGKKKKDTMELRFYEVPQGEYVLALLGDNWIRDYGHMKVIFIFTISWKSDIVKTVPAS